MKERKKSCGNGKTKKQKEKSLQKFEKHRNKER